MSFPILNNDLILRAIKGEEVERIPIWIMRQAGRYLPEFREIRAKYDFFTLCRTPELACEVTLQPIRRYALDAAIIFSDILVIPQALGMEVQMLPGKGPHFPQPLKSPEEIETRLPKSVDVVKELKYVFEAITLTRHKLNGQVPLIGFSGAPWTLMAYMIEGGGSKNFELAKKWLYCYPKQSHNLLTRITQVVIDYLTEQAKAGAQLLKVFDSWAGELSPSQFNEFCLPYLIQIVDSVKKRLGELAIDNVPMIVFAKGAQDALKHLACTAFDVIAIDWTIEPTVARQLVCHRKILQGNLDPCALFADRETIRREVKTMIDAFGTKNYIANLGHGMLPNHDPESVAIFIEAVADYSLKNKL